ncbi:MAG: hypothetical protein ACOYL6_09560 [Bacteriovoracaceae bacterium]
MKMLLMLLALTHTIHSYGFECADLSGRYELNSDSCEYNLTRDLVFPSNNGPIPLHLGSIIELKQESCNKISVTIDQNKSVPLSQGGKKAVLFSNYGMIVQEELKKVKDCPEYAKCGKFNISTQWNIDRAGSGGIVIKMNQEVKRKGHFKLAHKVHQVCELFRQL